jgi:hypothetical protein
VLDSNELLAGWLGKVPSELWKLLQKAAVNVKKGNNNKTVRRKWVNGRVKKIQRMCINVYIMLGNIIISLSDEN